MKWPSSDLITQPSPGLTAHPRRAPGPSPQGESYHSHPPLSHLLLAIYPTVLYPNPFLECPASVMVLCLGRDGKKNERFLSAYHVLKSTCEKSVGMGEVDSKPWGRLPITPGQ